MTDIWLSSNHRVLLLAMVPASLVGLVGLLGLWLDPSPVFRILSWLLIGSSAVLIVGLLIQLSRPRIAYRTGNLLFYLRAGPPIEVPIEVVEAFFLGQGPAHVPGMKGDSSKSINLIARLSQGKTEWLQREVKPALGSWCDGYVTFRGTWCEPLNEELVRRINQQLSEASRAWRMQACEEEEKDR